MKKIIVHNPVVDGIKVKKGLPLVNQYAEYNWKLRYAPHQITEKDYMTIASIMSAYCYLRENPGVDWKQKVEALEMKIKEYNG